MSDQGATATVVVIAGGRRMRGRAMVAMARACRVNTAAAAMRGRSMPVIAPIAMATSIRINTSALIARHRATAAMVVARACRLNTRIIPAIAAMAALVGDRTLSVITTVAVVAKPVPGSLRADSLPAVAVLAGNDIAQVVDARAGDAKPSGGDTGTDNDAPGYAAQIAPRHPSAFSV
jgi:hypothetical protein